MVEGGSQSDDGTVVVVVGGETSIDKRTEGAGWVNDKHGAKGCNTLDATFDQSLPTTASTQSSHNTILGSTSYHQSLLTTPASPMHPHSHQSIYNLPPPEIPMSLPPRLNHIHHPFNPTSASAAEPTTSTLIATSPLPYPLNPFPQPPPSTHHHHHQHPPSTQTQPDDTITWEGRPYRLLVQQHPTRCKACGVVFEKRHRRTLDPSLVVQLARVRPDGSKRTPIRPFVAIPTSKPAKPSNVRARRGSDASGGSKKEISKRESTSERDNWRESMHGVSSSSSYPPRGGGMDTRFHHGTPHQQRDPYLPSSAYAPPYLSFEYHHHGYPYPQPYGRPYEYPVYPPPVQPPHPRETSTRGAGDVVASTEESETRFSTMFGGLVSSCHLLTDLEGRKGAFFVFPRGMRKTMDLTMMVEGEGVGALAECETDCFDSLNPKDWTGMRESTDLSKHFADQGIKISIRRKLRRRPANRRLPLKSKDDEDEEDGTRTMRTINHERLSTFA
ncbi:velvet factor-domain-containing protein [Chytridium lagenaria]|nr:velvet factor-domain-containing protein [Chytridium lagenaria]